MAEPFEILANKIQSMERRLTQALRRSPLASLLHADLTGLASDDHPQYLLVDGSRAAGGSFRGGQATDVGTPGAPFRSAFFTGVVMAAGMTNLSVGEVSLPNFVGISGTDQIAGRATIVAQADVQTSALCVWTGCVVATSGAGTEIVTLRLECSSDGGVTWMPGSSLDVDVRFGTISRMPWSMSCAITTPAGGTILTRLAVRDSGLVQAEEIQHLHVSYITIPG